MLSTAHSQRTVGRLAWVAAWTGLVVGQLHALARHNTADGAGDLTLPLTRLWSDPARSALRPLLDWADPDTVYLTYGKIWLPVFVAFTLCAVVVRRRRRPSGFEKVAWAVALTGYALACVGVFLDYYTQWTSYLPDAVAGPMFAVTIAGLLLTLVGSTLLGIALLRRGGVPRLAGWLLALTIPLAAGVLQLTSMGSAALPIMFAFGLIGRDLAAEQPYAQVAGAPVSA
ncbi:hypothetical protein [Angustibacter sp. Root456]|uniref:hypothetical protein n=1 Tax=Angustibacter sp. Root456 TaxID=1736539 RepID=UPI0006FFB1F8|nr:hypothetical protein [Angustibacter sp. Root456]KQX66113.1 hypothetical protein ASD06_06910 [Angustibacter sp. Root456]